MFIFAELPGSIPGIRRPAHFFSVKNDEWRMADHDMIVEQDAAVIGAKSYIWKHCADNSCHGQGGNARAGASCFSVFLCLRANAISAHGHIHSKVRNNLKQALATT